MYKWNEKNYNKNCKIQLELESMMVSKFKIKFSSSPFGIIAPAATLCPPPEPPTKLAAEFKADAKLMFICGEILAETFIL